MLLKKLSACMVAALFFLLLSLNFKSAFAQEMPALYGVYPQRGSQGMAINLLLSGDGFHSLDELSSVHISGQEIPVLDYAVISNQLVWVLILIPESTATGEIEISFIFGNVGMDAYFVVTEVEDQEFSPEILQIHPQDGEVDTVVELFIQGARLFELGELGGVIIGRVETPVIDYAIESDRSMIIAVYLPPETPIGETGIRVFFENHSFEEFFFVRRPQPVEPEAPILHRLTPQEGLLDTDIELLLEGEGFFQLGDLVGLTVAGVDIPVLDYAFISNESMAIVVYLPPDLPTEETGIAFFFENTILEEFFFVRGREPAPVEPLMPNLRGINPREGEVDTVIQLFLEGVNFFELGEPIGVSMSGIDIPVLDYEIGSNELMVMSVYLPEDLPMGEQIITFFFENAGFEEFFFINAPPPPEFPTTTQIPPPPAPEFPTTMVIVGVMVLVGVSSVLARRSKRRRKTPTEGPRDSPIQPQAKMEFTVEVDPGTQSVELAEPLQKLAFNLRFEIEVDKGKQNIEMEGSSIIKGE